MARIQWFFGGIWPEFSGFGAFWPEFSGFGAFWPESVVFGVFLPETVVFWCISARNRGFWVFWPETGVFGVLARDSGFFSESTVVYVIESTVVYVSESTVVVLAKTDILTKKCISDSVPLLVTGVNALCPKLTFLELLLILAKTADFGQNHDF